MNKDSCKFKISDPSRFNHIVHYCVEIMINNNLYLDDENIAKLLNIEYYDYIQLAKSFSAKQLGAHSDLWFIQKEQVEIFADYLNDKYLVMLKLTGKV